VGSTIIATHAPHKGAPYYGETFEVTQKKESPFVEKYLGKFLMGDQELEVSVVLPTYNEAENTPIIIPKICSVLANAGIHGEVIVVDDNSPDGTEEVVRRLSETLPIRIAVRTEDRGLATAVIAGFEMSAAKVCVVMDADGSHPVEKLPEMIKPILADHADITVGSRYVTDGGIGQWPLHRQIVSKAAALMTLGLTKMSDPTSGFMAIRRKMLQGIKLNPVGWKIVLEIVVKAETDRIIEVPIAFIDRELGESKMSAREQWNYIKHLYRLYKFRLTESRR
jgi:dolichol-phosphate mannosyltransferase